MLPTKGYFQDIECPYFESSCGRPYCHFRHRKKPTENLEDIATEACKEEAPTIPTYKPTPKSELANIHNSKSHIPISYVPDLAFRADRKSRPFPKFDKPTYKPTPLSILSSANKRCSISEDNGEHTEAIKEIKQNIANVEYNPAISLQPTTDIDFEDLSTEFDLIDEIINSNDGTSKMIIDHVNIDALLEIDKNEMQESLRSDEEINNVSLEPDINETKLNLQLEDTKVAPKQEEKVEQSKIIENIDVKYEKHRDRKEKHVDDVKLIKNVNKVKRERNEKYEKKDKSKQSKLKTSEKSDDEMSKGSKEKKRSEKHNSVEAKRSEKEKSSSSKEKTKVNKKTLNEKSHKNNSQDKHQKEQKKERKEERHSSHKSKYKRRDRSRSKERKKNRDCEMEKEKNKRHCDNNKKHKSKSKEKDSHKTHHKHSKSDKIHSKSKSEESEKIPFEESSDDSNANIPMLCDTIENNFSDLDLDDDDETMLECYKIFNEYKPPVKAADERDTRKKLVEEDASVSPEDDLSLLGKKRIAHANIEKTVTYSQLHPPNKLKTVNAPGQVLSNRYKIAKLSQASKEQEFIMNEMSQPILPSKRPAPTLLEAAREQKLRKEHSQARLAGRSGLVDDIIKGTTKPTLSQPKIVVRKIAAAQNVGLIEKAKERISKIKQNTQIKTIAQTQKSGRVAHVPEMSLSDIPDVLLADKSKLPVNVRTRFLTLIADECLKLYISKEEAFTRALNEEFSCYEKCKVLATYRNSSMLAINRLRRETQERDKLGLGLIGLGEEAGKGPSDFVGPNFYNNVKKWILTSEELDIHGYPRESEEHRGHAIIKNQKTTVLTNLDSNRRTCCRCHKMYQVDDDGWPLFEEECLYHPLKKRTIRGEQTYLCCRSNDGTGCATSDTHVSESSCEAELEGFQITMDPEYEDDSRSYAVYALDCEMCYTTKGLELTRVTIVDSECKTVYESLVKPLNPIIDYNTRFSGITKEQMDKTSTSILQIQANILHLCNSKTILMGHSLESDMKALKIAHETVIDTSVLFPHKMGLPHKRALKALASEHLRKIIQNDISGHDSAEDAITCMELIKWKLKDELKLRGPK